jgi:hypothetical protein
MSAFQATFHKAVPVMSRGVIQLIFEVASELQENALNVTGGMMARPGEADWFEIKRLNTNGDGTASPSGGEAVTPAGGGLPARPERKLSQQAGACCSDPRFQKWLGAVDRDEAANIVRLRCGVGSRSEIIPGTPAGELWVRMYDRFRIWCDVPELETS